MLASNSNVKEPGKQLSHKSGSKKRARNLFQSSHTQAHKQCEICTVSDATGTIGAMCKSQLRHSKKLQNNICVTFYYITAEVPTEILFGGQLAMLMYRKALRHGHVNVYRGRIFLIGQDRAGKTSLKKSLLGLPFDSKEESTEGIDPSKCEIDVNRVQNWHCDSKNTILSEVSEQISRSLCVAVELAISTSHQRESSSSTSGLGASSEQGSKENEVTLSDAVFVDNGQVSVFLMLHAMFNAACNVCFKATVRVLFTLYIIAELSLRSAPAEYHG